MQAGKDVILEIEIQGAMKIKEQFPESLLLFVTLPVQKNCRRDWWAEEPRQQM